MIFEINETSKVDFSIVIAGTQMRPTEVRVVLGDKVKLMFPASSDDGINYSALITPLKDVVSSVCLFTIEVLFGNKIFVPIRRQITINDSTFVVQVVDSNLEPEVPAYIEPEVPIPIEPTVEPVIEPKIEIAVEPEVEVVVTPAIELNKPIEQKPVTEKINQPSANIFETVTKDKQVSSKIKTLKPHKKPQALPPINLPPMQLPKFEKARKAMAEKVEKVVKLEKVVEDAPIIAPTIIKTPVNLPPINLPPMQLPKFEKARKVMAENKITKAKVEKQQPMNIEVDKIKVTKAILAEKDTTTVVPKKAENKPKITENINNAVSFKREEIVYI